jgi:hypothetical protein
LRIARTLATAPRNNYWQAGCTLADEDGSACENMAGPFADRYRLLLREQQRKITFNNNPPHFAARKTHGLHLRTISRNQSSG